jgi:glycosyltransferase involved in cell wall biosynthesis
MKICLVGGIFDRDPSVRSKHLLTPETILLDGFQKAGVDVAAVGHAHFQPSDAYDIIHVHHQGKAALKMASANCPARFVFTGHNGVIVTGYERSRLRRSAFQYVLDRADAVVALSHAEARYFAGVGLGPKVRVIPNGIPAGVFRPQARRQDKARFELLYVGQLIDWKGVNFLLEAVAQLRRRWDLRLRLVFHNAHLEKELKALAQDLGIIDAVEFVGILGPEELAAAYAEADLLVLPSFADCLPSVVTEAFLCGTPVVAGAVCGVPEQVGPYGEVVPPGDVPALAAAIEKVLRDPQGYQGRADAMRAYAQEKYNPADMVRAHLDLYQDLLHSRAGRSRRPGSWVDPFVRLAIRVYWARGRRTPGKSRAFAGKA